MLTTQQEHELPRYPFATGPGVATWRTVTLHAGVMYVFVSYAIKHAGGWLPQTSVFWRHEDVLEFCRHIKKDKNRKVVEIFLLTPSLSDSAYQWGIIPIRAVFVSPYDESDSDFPLYVSIDGEIVGGVGLGESDEEMLINYNDLESVFLWENLK